MNAIVAVTRDWGIGLGGDLLIHDCTDMRNFVRLTKGGTVIMGRKTLESFPGGRPLKGRRNIVLTGNANLGVPTCDEGTTCELVHSLEEALAAAAGDDPERVWVIGGARVYRELLPYCDRAVVTKFDTTLPADVFFPNLDEDSAWEIEGVETGAHTADGVAFDFVTYRRRA